MKFYLKAATALCAMAMAAGTAHAQAPGYETPKTTWGAPDLQGFWNNTSITSLQRPGGVDKLVLSPTEADRMVNRNMLVVLSKADDATNGDDPNNTKILEDRNADRGYNAFWIDPGTKVASVKGELRSSWIVEPASGRIPYKPGAAASGGGYSITNFDGPETRPIAERCVLSFSGSYGPVMLNSMYNNTFQFVQTPGAVMILVEMNHDVRNIPIVAGPAEAKHGSIPKWGGDSVGWYEGNTLVVQTTNVHPSQRAMITGAGKLTERFTRWDDNQITYEFEVNDPSLYSQPWKGEMALNVAEPLYEYACHEGNHAMAGILAGARQIESEGKVPGMGPGIAAGLVLPRDDQGGEGSH